MRKSTLFLVMMLLMGSLSGYAQWLVTPEAGITAVHKKESYDGNWDAGWKIGAAVEYRFKESPFSLKSGLYYTQRGYKEYPYYLKTPDFDNEEYSMTVQGDINRHVLQLPVMAQLGWDIGRDIRLNVAAGGYVGYYIQNSYSLNFAGYSPYPSDYGYAYGYGYGNGYYHNYPGPFDGLRKFNWGLTGSVGLEIQQWVINASYEAAMAKEYKWDDVAFKFHTISLSLGYKFKL